LIINLKSISHEKNNTCFVPISNIKCLSFAQIVTLPSTRKPSEAKNNEELISILKQNNDIKKSLILQKLNGQPARTLTPNGGVIEAGRYYTQWFDFTTTLPSISEHCRRTISTDKKYGLVEVWG
jgi:hypothetical protein